MLRKLLNAGNALLRPLGLRVIRARAQPLSPRAAFTIPHVDFRVEAVAGGVGRDPSPYPGGHLSVLPGDLAVVVDAAEFSGARVLEVGPKFGYHSRWLDDTLHPSHLLLLERATDIDHGYVDDLACPVEISYEDLLTVAAPAQPFDLLLCLGVLYHNVEHFRLLAKLWTLARPGALLVLETTVTPLGEDLADPVLELRWHGRRGGSYLLPSSSAVLTMLAMTGWNDVCWYVDYRTVDSAMLLTCRRSDSRPASHLGSPFGIVP